MADFITRLRAVTVSGLFLTVLASPVMADKAEGLWLTGPDKKGQVGHVKLAPCGASLCGTVIKAFDKSGKDVITQNVGKRVIWDVKPTGGGDYSGRMLVSQLKATVDGVFHVAGNKMTVKGCVKKLCQSQVWTRLK
ncbi:DUF2147 domain-containing protein [Rhodobacteraceae bacterium D3-12]|nr:DUF2147 domain-containing protein [Rhodobacteraceae bacterium D3-12]